MEAHLHYVPASIFQQYFSNQIPERLCKVLQFDPIEEWPEAIGRDPEVHKMAITISTIFNNSPIFGTIANTRLILCNMKQAVTENQARKSPFSVGVIRKRPNSTDDAFLPKKKVKIVKTATTSEAAPSQSPPTNSNLHTTTTLKLINMSINMPLITDRHSIKPLVNSSTY